MEFDLDTRAKMALLIGKVIEPLDSVDLMLPVIATALHVWCEDRNKDIIEVVNQLEESVMTANGFEIAGENDK